MRASLIVDGNNIINACGMFKCYMSDFETARSKLIDIMSEFSDYYDYRVTVVFDGNGHADAYNKKSGIEILFSGTDKDADSLIEKKVYDAKDRYGMTVITNDTWVRNISRGMGALVIDSAYFEKMAVDMSKDTDSRLRSMFLISKLRHIHEKI